MAELNQKIVRRINYIINETIYLERVKRSGKRLFAIGMLTIGSSLYTGSKLGNQIYLIGLGLASYGAFSVGF